jgi:hypothetical protein
VHHAHFQRVLTCCVAYPLTCSQGSHAHTHAHVSRLCHARETRRHAQQAMQAQQLSRGCRAFTGACSSSSTTTRSAARHRGRAVAGAVCRGAPAVAVVCEARMLRGAERSPVAAGIAVPSSQQHHQASARGIHAPLPTCQACAQLRTTHSHHAVGCQCITSHAQCAQRRATAAASSMTTT